MDKSRARAFILTAFLWVITFVLALKLGAVDDPSFNLIMEIRLPRVILATVVGAGLSVAGAALQALFSNPLCEPYTLGISSGAALGAVLGISFGLQWMVAGVAGTAFAGAMVFAGVLYFISHYTARGNASLLLAGVMLGFLGNSLVALWIVLADSNGLQSALVWLFGDLSQARLKGAAFSAAGVFLATLLIWGQWRSLDALLIGEEGAESVGIDVGSARRKIIFLSSILIGLCVSAGGMIGFVGLIVPHLARRWVGSLHLALIPLCAMLGAVVLTTADWMSRILLKPYELPVGVVTALIGAPVFLWIMLKNQRHV